MGHFSWIDWGVLILYFGAMAGLGPLFAHKAKTTEGYFLGDRSFPGWLVGFSMFATSISSMTFVAYPADAYKTAWFRMTPNYMLPIAILFASVFFLPFFRRTRITSAYEYLEERFGPWTRVYAASAFIIGQTIRVSLILYLVSVLIYEMSGRQISPVYSILIGGIVTSFYTILGGIRAVLWTDFIQAIVLFGGGLIALFAIVTKVGGFGEVISMAAAAGKFSMSDLEGTTLVPIKWTPDLTEKTVILFAFVGLSNWLTEYTANQNVIQRYAASKSARQARVAMWVCCVFSVPTWGLFMLLGTALWVFYQKFPTPEAMAMLTGEAKAEQILPYFVITELPAGLTGLVIAAVLAAAMSSLSSSINSVSAVSVVDIYRRHIAPGRSDTHYVVAAKLVGLALAVFMIVGATILYRFQSKTLQDSATVLGALSMGGLLGIYLIGFFTKIGDDRAILTAILFTVAFTLWMALASLPNSPIAPPFGIHNYYSGLLGHIIMFAIGYTMGLLLPARKRNLRNLTVYTQDATPLD